MNGWYGWYGKYDKLVFMVHLSGNFEDPGFT